jgi:predicted acylesterase/phospholipase RssA
MDSNIVKELSRVLVNNIDDSSIKVKDINLITSGGAFNASYLVGCLYVIREMREKGLIKINKISTCSASSIIGLLFLIDKLDVFVDKLYDVLVKSFKKNKIVIFDEESLSNIIKMVTEELPEDVTSIINDKLYITYYDVLECKQVSMKM